MTAHVERKRGTEPVYSRSRYLYDTNMNIDSTGDNGRGDCNGEGVLRTRVDGERTDANDVTTYCSDNHGRVARTVDAHGNVRKASYTGNSNVEQLNSSGADTGTPFTYSYDSNDNMKQVGLPSGGTASMDYTDSANPHSPTSVRDFANSGSGSPTWQYEYDGEGHLITAYAAGPDIRYRYCYDGMGLLQRIDPPNDSGVNSSAPVGSTETVAPDKNKDQGCGYASRGNDTLLSYDSDGHLTKVDPPGANGTRTYTYDALSRIASMTDGRGIRTRYTYDGLDRTVRVVYDDDPAVAGQAMDGTVELAWTYDLAGNMTFRIDAGGRTEFTYDELNRRIRQERSHPQDLVNVVDYTYDPADNLKTLTQLGDVTSYSYDAVNLVTAVNDPRTTAPITFGYDKRDNRTRTTYPMPGADLVQEAAYDDGGRMTCIYSYLGTAPSTRSNGCPERTASGLFTFYEYSYRTNGRETNTRYAMWEIGGRKTSYAYDAIQRLTKATTGAASDPVREYTYTYDRRSNLLREQVRGSMEGLDKNTTTLAVNDANELCWSLQATTTPASQCGSTPSGATTYTYDGAGSLTGGTGGSFGGLALTYNPIGQTVGIDPAGSVGNQAMRYAGATQDVRFTAGDIRYSDTLLGISTQSTSSGTTHEEWFVRDPEGTPLAMIDKIGVEPDWYYLTDSIGSVMAIVNTNGIMRRYVYEPYGEQLKSFTGSPSTGGTSTNLLDPDAGAGTALNVLLDGDALAPKDTEADYNPYRFAGGYYDRTTGMLKFGTRYYIPALTRWSQTDPKQGTTSAPPTLNPYGYVGGDPTNSRDASGRDFWSIGGEGCYVFCLGLSLNFEDTGDIDLTVSSGLGYPGVGGGAMYSAGSSEGGFGAPSLGCSAGYGAVSVDTNGAFSGGLGTYASTPTCSVSLSYTFDF